MKAVRIIATLVIVVAVAAIGVAGEKAWIDMDNCGFCVNLSSQKGLMDNMSWNHYLIKDGVMSVTTFPEDYRETYDKAMAEMMTVGEKLKTGEKVDMCGFCTGYGELAAAGTNIESVTTKGGVITLMTHTDPEMVKKIKTFGQTTIDALAMTHEGHEHSESEK